MSAVPFQAFFDAHADVVLGFLVSLVGRHDADDCFQETFIAALRAYPKLDRGTNHRAWILRIARNKAVDNYRASRRRPVPVAEPADSPAAPVTEADSLDGIDPELWSAVGELPEKQRAAIFLRYVADLSHRDVAAAMDISEEAARRNAHEGLKKLEEAFA
jgi:RNA polymerase sigma factor (sigma-70 family)